MTPTERANTLLPQTSARPYFWKYAPTQKRNFERRFFKTLIDDVAVHIQWI